MPGESTFIAKHFGFWFVLFYRSNSIKFGNHKKMFFLQNQIGILIQEENEWLREELEEAERRLEETLTR